MIINRKIFIFPFIIRSTDPRCKVIRCSSCLFGKQMCQTNAAAAMKSVYKLLWYCCTCIALRVLRYATQFVTLLAAHTAFVTAALVSFMPLRSFRPSFRFTSPRSQLDHLLQGMAHYPHTKQSTSDAHTFSQANATILTGLRSATLRPPFTSVAFSTPAANNLARLAATVCVTGLHWH